MRRTTAIIIFAVLAALFVFHTRKRQQAPAATSHYPASTNPLPHRARSTTPASERWKRTSQPTQLQSAEEIVLDKLAKFAESRRRLARQLADKSGVTIPPQVEAFFAAVESGDWKRIETTFTALDGGDSTGVGKQKRAPEVQTLWPAILDAFGAAEQAHLLPAQELLDYGHSILDSLRPGMVYVGGTDASRWVPALVNDTEEGDRHVVITQNGLADRTYLDYVALQFGGRMSTLDNIDADEAFNAYVADARKRLEHDQNFPNEPKQLRPQEEVKIVDGKIDVSGNMAFMDINERLLNKLLQKNPDLSFAVGESYPMKGTYADAVPLGPLMELRADARESFISQRAADSLEYWRSTTDLVLNDPAASPSDGAKKNYSHDASAAANLLAAHGFNNEAEAAYQLARQLWPGSSEVSANLAELYQRTGRATEAEQLLQKFVREFPAERKTLKDFWGIELDKLP